MLNRNKEVSKRFSLQLNLFFSSDPTINYVRIYDVLNLKSFFLSHLFISLSGTDHHILQTLNIDQTHLVLSGMEESIHIHFLHTRHVLRPWLVGWLVAIHYMSRQVSPLRRYFLNFVCFVSHLGMGYGGEVQWLYSKITCHIIHITYQRKQSFLGTPRRQWQGSVCCRWLVVSATATDTTNINQQLWTGPVYICVIA